MKVGIVGLPGTGKTTLFNALTHSHAAIHAYTAREDEVHLGSVEVPDERFDFAVSVCLPKKQVRATVELVDGGARIDLGENRQKFGSDFFAGVRNMDALVLCLRAFESETIPAPPEGIDPKREAEAVLGELLLADLVTIDSRLERLDKARLQKRLTAGDAAEEQTLRRVKAHLENLKPVRTLELSADEERSIRSFGFVSGKPIILVANLSESDVAAPERVTGQLRAFAAENRLELIELCASVEMECAQMEREEEHDFLQAMGIGEPSRDKLIRAAYRALGYLTFFTVGEDEVRAWTLRVGSTALQAAERIHTEIARTFIRAETMAFEEFREAGGWDAAKHAGKMRLEGKEYLVKDGDIIHIRNSKG